MTVASEQKKVEAAKKRLEAAKKALAASKKNGSTKVAINRNRRKVF